MSTQFPDTTLAQTANRIRRDALAMIHGARSGHPGGALSCADLLAVLVSEELGWPAGATGDALARNRLVLSKGHACPALYAAAAHCGLIPRAELGGFRRLGRALQGHPHVLATPWAETSTGSLGQGFSVAVGMAMGLRHQGGAARVYALLGDGELQEGEVWEAAMCAAHHGLANLCAVVDYNKLQSDDRNARIMGLEPLTDKWAAFGWRVLEVDGHDLARVRGAFAEARAETARPTVIIAHTLKGKGVTFMEDVPQWHGSVALRDEELEQALRDLGASEHEIQSYKEGRQWQ